MTAAPEVKPVDPPPLDEGRPHVWLLDVRVDDFDALADTGLPSTEDRRRAEAVSNAAAARGLLARRAAMRLILAGYRAVRPEEVRVVTAPGGKPVLVPGRGDADMPLPITFSVCHSGDLYGIAVGSSRSLGLDVERLRHVPRARAIAERWFGVREADALGQMPEDELDRAFMRLWTAKEALAKRHGAGLRLMRGDGDELDVEAALAEERLRHFEPGAEYTGALASSEPIEEVVVLNPERMPWTT